MVLKKSIVHTVNQIMNHQTELQNIAQKVIAKSGMNTSDNHGSVILTLMFISIILTTIRVLQECNKNKNKDFYTQEIGSLSKKRSWFTKMRLKKIIRQQLNNEDYKKYKDNIVTAILDVAGELTEDQINMILEVA